MAYIAEKDWTIREAISWAEDYLAQHDVPDAKIEAEYLLAHALECKMAELFLNHAESLSHQALQEFTTFVERRIKREPSQYIIGGQEFWGLSFKVTRDILIPRPETEVLVEEAVKTVRSQKSEVRSQNTKNHYSELRSASGRPNSELTLLDLCTGSGCIAVVLAKEIPDSRIYATDVSEKALDVARENAERHGVVDRITFIHGELFEPINGMNPVLRHNGTSIKFDIIVSNPPYISKKMMKELQPEIKDYEPAAALCGGDDGLDFYRRIISESPKYLAKDGCILLEMGYGQAEEIKELIWQSKAFEHIDIKKDFAGIDRVIKARIKG